MMTITFCDKVITVDKNHLTEILDNQGYRNGQFAVAVNQQFVPRQKYNQTIIREGDIIDIIMPMQGG